MAGATGGPWRLTDAERDLAEFHRGLVWRIALRWAGPGEPADDLAQAGMFGLFRATRAFRPEFGSKFSFHAARYIKNAIREHRLRDRTAYIPPGLRVGRRDGRSDAAPGSPDRTCRIMSLGCRAARLGIAGDPTRPESRVDREDSREAVRRAVSALPIAERLVIEARMRDGLFREIGEAMGVGRDTVRRMEARAHAKLREMLADYA